MDITWNRIGSTLLAALAVAGIGLAVNQAAAEPRTDPPTHLAESTAAAGAGAGPEAPTTSQPGLAAQLERIKEIDAATRELDARSTTMSIYDRGVGGIVQIEKSWDAAEIKRVSRDPDYLDASGNPRYVLVWENRRLVPGPALTCKSSPNPGEPATCRIVGDDLPAQ